MFELESKNIIRNAFEMLRHSFHFLCTDFMPNSLLGFENAQGDREPRVCPSATGVLER